MTSKLLMGACFLALVAPLAVRAQDKMPWERAADRDPLQAKHERPTIKGAYRTPYGLQFHPSCIAQATAAGGKRTDALSGFNRALDRAFELMSACEGRYPELKGYIGEWVTQMRRTVMTCTKKTQAQVNAGAANYWTEDFVNGDGFRGSDLEKEAREGLDLDGIPFASLPRHYKTVIVLPSDTAQGVAAYPNGGDPEWTVDSLIHEILHSTHANNRADHNEAEAIGPGEKGACGDDIRNDRINVIATLCSGDHLHRGGNAQESRETAIELHDKIDSCGSKKGCENVFTQTIPDEAGGLLQSWDGYYSQSRGLGVKDAQSLCAKLYDRGACHAQLLKSGGKLTHENAVLEGFGQRIAQRIKLMFPVDRAELSNQAIAAFPGLSEKVAAARSTECFKAIFTETSQGFQIDKPAHLPGPHAMVGRPYHLENNFTIRYAEKQTSGECTNAKGGKEVGALRDNLKAWLDSAFSSQTYGMMYGNRANGMAEGEFEFDQRSLKRSDEWAFGQIIGQNGLTDYLNALKSDHYKSPDFDCKANGLSIEADLTAAFAAQSKGRACQ